LNDYADVQDIDEDDIDILLHDDDITDDELELYCLQMEKRRAKKIAFNMKIVHAALRMIAGISAISTCIRDVVKSLAARFDKSYKQLNLQSQNVVDCPIVNFLNWFQVDWFNDKDWLKTHSKRICLAVSSVADSFDWFERAWFDETQWLESSHTAVAEMKKPCTVDTVNGNSHTVDTVDTVYSSMNQSLMNQARSCAEHVITRQLTEL
jgi:hypothetical protein